MQGHADGTTALIDLAIKKGHFLLAVLLLNRRAAVDQPRADQAMIDGTTTFGISDVKDTKQWRRLF